MQGLQSGSPTVAKTIKLFINGEFPRTESGRSFPVYIHQSKKIYAHLCRASRKDLRNSVAAAAEAQKGWAGKTAYNRGQILYRMAEMTEGKREELMQVLIDTLGNSKKAAQESVDAAIDAFVYYAGWADKYQQVIGAVNPVSGPFHNFTTPEPVGVVGMIADAKFDLGQLVAQIAAIVVTGNSLVVLMAEKGAAVLAPLSEVFATSDLPKGVINLLTGQLDELADQFGQHMEIQSLSCQNTSATLLTQLKQAGAENMKRVAGPQKAALSLEALLDFVEFKTVWHPIGH